MIKEIKISMVGGKIKDRSEDKMEYLKLWIVRINKN